jgi:hypothetical protein
VLGSPAAARLGALGTLGAGQRLLLLRTMEQ